MIMYCIQISCGLKLKYDTTPTIGRKLNKFSDHFKPYLYIYMYLKCDRKMLQNLYTYITYNVHIPIITSYYIYIYL